jgi:transglutaminase-like putative cysteine protease
MLKLAQGTRPLAAALVAALLQLWPAEAAALAPQVVDTRTVRLTQTVTLHDIPAGAGQVRLWVPIPGDGPWQRVVDGRVVSAPGTWAVHRLPEGRGTVVHAELRDPPPGAVSVVFECTVERQGVHFPLASPAPAERIQAELFGEALDAHAPYMEVSAEVRALADAACGEERDVGKQALALMRLVAEKADHYSKDPARPSCGVGSVENCLAQGGGCCTDLHSLYIALARARGIPARIQFGYRLLDAKAGAPYDPGYRCWGEVFVPGQGWVPNDIVASDGAKAVGEQTWASLSATRVWLWEGRNFELVPPAAAGRINVMFGGWAEIDGKPVQTLPAADGTPSALRRTVQFEVLDRERAAEAAPLPE